MKKISTVKITQTAMVSAVALVLSNIATMFALSAMSLPSALVVCLTKALFVLLMRGFTAFLMSLCGGVLSAVVMYLLMKFKRVGFVGVGVGGAFSHNLGQILIAFLFTDSTVFAYFSVLGLASVVTGTVTALAVYLILPKVLSIGLYRS